MNLRFRENLIDFAIIVLVCIALFAIAWHDVGKNGVMW